MSLTKLSLAGNNVPNPSPREVWSKIIQESRNISLQCMFFIPYAEVTAATPDPEGSKLLLDFINKIFSWIISSEFI